VKSLIVSMVLTAPNILLFFFPLSPPPFPKPLFLARGGFFGVKKLEKEEVLREGGESLRRVEERRRVKRDNTRER